MNLTKLALTPCLSALIALSTVMISESSVAANCCMLKNKKKQSSCITTSRKDCLAHTDYELFRPTMFCKKNKICVSKNPAPKLNVLPKKDILLQPSQPVKLNLILKKPQPLN